MAWPKLQPVQPVSVADYLALERIAQERHEYLDGRVRAMAGESPEHGDVSANLLGSLVQQLKGTPCRARTKDTKVRSGPALKAGETTHCLFSYPDIVILCGEPEYLDGARDVVLNPKAIVEVLSKSTEAFDRGEKFIRYQTWNESLSDYVLVAQDKPQVEYFSRQSDGAWTYRLVTGLDAYLTIDSINCRLNLAEVYDRIQFPPAQDTMTGLQ